MCWRVCQKKLAFYTKDLNVEFYYFFYLVFQMTEARTIKVSKETYKKLWEIAGELQMLLKRPISLDEALNYLISTKGKSVKITDLAGSWEISDDELAEIKASLAEAWKRWRLTEL
jgi:hypothetical protein